MLKKEIKTSSKKSYSKKVSVEDWLKAYLAAKAAPRGPQWEEARAALGKIEEQLRKTL